MKVTVVDRLIRHNIALFQHLMRRQLEKKQRFNELLQRTYRAYINCETGELSFQDLGKGWKSVLLFFSEKDGEFEVNDVDNETCFDCSKLNEKAMKVMVDTLKTMSGVCAEPPQRRKIENIVRNLIELEIELPLGDSDPMHAAWHSIDRYHAEYLLEKAAVGTYLFRKGEFASQLEEQLNEESIQPVVCITVTYRGWEGKIAEKIIVFRNGDWLFYDDDPDLEGECYSTLNELIATQEDLFRLPLKN
ncbi:MAG: hypothetical protein K940chlam2_00097 [Chlamydiae bacterium]|nr:hypothetical protein [Chlamydiota bacterium]